MGCVKGVGKRMNNKRKMKKIIAMIITAIFVVGSLAACRNGKEGSAQTGASSAADNGEKLQIVLNENLGMIHSFSFL